MFLKNLFGIGNDAKCLEIIKCKIHNDI
jgi:hypothetical protein